MMKYDLFTIEQIRELELSVLMYRYHKNLLPYELQNLFQINNSEIITRINSKIIKNLCNTPLRSRLLNLLALNYGSKYPKNLQNINSTKAFVKNMKKYIVTI